MALKICTECDGTISDTAPVCPHCGHLRRAMLPDLPAVSQKPSSEEATQKVVYVGCTVLLVLFCGWMIIPDCSGPNSRKTKRSTNAATRTTLPAHRFLPTEYGRAQVRAIVAVGSLTEAYLRRTAVDLCEEYKHLASGHFLVEFFSDESCLQQWDGSGLRDSDWPYWLCRITVDTNTSGKLYARTFKLGLVMSTGKERTDVLKITGKPKTADRTPKFLRDIIDARNASKHPEELDAEAKFQADALAVQEREDKLYAAEQKAEREAAAAKAEREAAASKAKAEKDAAVAKASFLRANAMVVRADWPQGIAWIDLAKWEALSPAQRTESVRILGSFKADKTGKSASLKLKASPDGPVLAICYKDGKPQLMRKQDRE